MRRREILKLLGATSLLSTLRGFAADDGVSKPIWKTAIGLNGFASSSRKYNKAYPIREVLEFASKTGFDGIELTQNWPTKGYPSPDQTDRIRALRRMHDGFKLQIFSVQTSAGGAFAPHADARRQWVDTMRNHCRLAKALGCDCIGMWPGGPLRGQTIDQAIERVAASFREVGKIAGDLGLVAAFEIEPPFVFNTEDHLRRILAAANHPNVKTIFDPSHFDLMNASNGRPHEMLKRIGVENIGYVHFTDTDGTLRDGGTSKHLPCGDGHADVDAALATLRDGGFRGWIMIDAWEIPDPYDAGVKGLKAIRDAMSA